MKIWLHSYAHSYALFIGACFTSLCFGHLLKSVLGNFCNFGYYGLSMTQRYGDIIHSTFFLDTLRSLSTRLVSR